MTQRRTAEQQPLPDVTTAIRATECGHVLAQSSDARLIQRLRDDHAMLLRIGDARFEMVEMDLGEALEAFVCGLSGCPVCPITPDQLAKVAALVRGEEATSDG